MSELYGEVDDAESILTIQHALDLGITLFDTADSYGIDGHNERLLGRALADRREDAVVATKLGNMRDPDGTHRGVNGRPEYVRQACERSLSRLGMEVIDLYQLHRVDPTVPIEETVGAMAELVAEGKVRYLGLSEVKPSDLRRAAAVADVASLQTEYSLFERHVEEDILDTCAELSISFLAYAPLGRGLLTGSFRSASDFTESDYRIRSNHPRFANESLDRLSEFLRPVEEIARKHNATPSQIALAWLLSQREWVVPIAGTKRRTYVEQNAAASTIVLDEAELEMLDAIVGQAGSIPGDRYPGGRTPTATTPLPGESV